jgi:SAM-dependent methyltransferase
MGATVYRGKRFEYQQCLDCDSAFVLPMPDRETLEQMYGDDYGQFISLDEAHSGGEGSEMVLQELGKHDAGSFLDFGCGGGHLLRQVAEREWQAFGVEFDRMATDKINAAMGISVVSSLDELPPETEFDAIHMGDVIEHLTDVDADMPRILARLRPSGLLIAQGPLEANFNLFLTGLRLKKLVRDTDSTMPPYHVMLATSAGQQKLFSRFGFERLRFDIFETAHPAPEKIGIADLANVRATSLFALRRFSQTFSRLFKSTAGNRYFYVGRKVG